MYYRESGIKYCWLDCDEPCDYTGRIAAGDRILWNNGSWPDVVVGAQYPTALNRAIFRYMNETLNEPDIVTLARSAWAGSQRWGVVVWSGDTSSTWESLRNQISEGQSAALSVISYWASDIGGYQGLSIANVRGFDMDLLLRWFQFGMFSAIFRVHGYRSPSFENTLPCSSDTSDMSGLGLTPTSAANEAYTFTSADDIFNYSAAIIKTIRLHESMRQYVVRVFHDYVRDGSPVMSPMFYEFPFDPICSSDLVSDQYMFGKSLLVAPIYSNCSSNFSCTSRYVYLPALPGDQKWTNIVTKETFLGSVNVNVESRRDEFPVFSNIAVESIFTGKHKPWNYHE